MEFNITPYIALYSYAKELSALAKNYTKALKYSRDNNNFNFKLWIFYNLYIKAKVPLAALLIAILTILKGEALNYYYSNIANINIVSYSNIVQSIKNNFKGAKYQYSI